MQPFWVPILTIGGTLLGIVVGALISRSNEHKQWLRNEKIKLYSEYLDMFGNAQFANIFKAMDVQEPGEEIFEFYNRVHELGMRVILVAPGEIIDEVQKTMSSVLDLQLFASNLPGEMNRKYFRPGQSEAEQDAKQEAMMAEIMEQLRNKVESHALKGYARLETITNLMRDDLRVSGSVPRGFASRLGIGKPNG